MNLKKILGITLLSLMSLTSVKAQKMDFSLKIPYNISNKTIIAEPTAQYTLPGNIDGFTFVDLFSGGYYSQTDLTKSTKFINARSRILSDNELVSKIGIGLNKDISLFNDRCYISLSLLPAWFDKKGFIERQTIDYFFDIDLSHNWSLNGFGEWEHQKGHVNWVYGELDFGKKFEKEQFRLSYSPQILKKEEKGVELTHRVALTYFFK